MWFNIKAFFIWLLSFIHSGVSGQPRLGDGKTSKPGEWEIDKSTGVWNETEPLVEEPGIEEEDGSEIKGADWPPPPPLPPLELAPDSAVPEAEPTPEPDSLRPVDDGGQLTVNFHIDEFCCADGAPVPPKYVANVLVLAVNLQVLRDCLGMPVKICSGYRTPKYNQRVSGAPLSLHLRASAADVSAEGVSPEHLAERIRELVAAGKMAQGGVGFYPAFTHYDTSGGTNFWKGHRKHS